MTGVGSVTIYEGFKDGKTLTQATGKLFIWIPLGPIVTGVLHHLIFCIKIRSLPDLTISWSKNLIFSDKVLIVFEKASVNFWGIILCLWLRINNPSKICMSQLYIVVLYLQLIRVGCSNFCLPVTDSSRHHVTPSPFFDRHTTATPRKWMIRCHW